MCNKLAMLSLFLVQHRPVWFFWVEWFQKYKRVPCRKFSPKLESAWWAQRRKCVSSCTGTKRAKGDHRSLPDLHPRLAMCRLWSQWPVWCHPVKTCRTTPHHSGHWALAWWNRGTGPWNTKSSHNTSGQASKDENTAMEKSIKKSLFLHSKKHSQYGHPAEVVNATTHLLHKWSLRRQMDPGSLSSRVLWKGQRSRCWSMAWFSRVSSRLGGSITLGGRNTDGGKKRGSFLPTSSAWFFKWMNSTTSC